MLVFRKTIERNLKLKAVKMLKKGDKTAKQIAEKLGVKYATLLYWKKAYELRGIKAFPVEYKWFGEKSPFLSKEKLIRRGWTEKAINKFLGRVSKKVENPRGKKLAPICLYSRERVEKAEKEPEFIKWKEKKDAKKGQYKKMVDTKTTNTINMIKKSTIEVIRDDAYLKNAIEQYNDWHHRWNNIDSDFHYDVEERPYAAIDSDPEFLNRISVNYIRHCCSDYEWAIRTLFGHVGRKKAYIEVVRKTFQEIIKVYPELKEECEKQMNRRLQELQDIEDRKIEKYFRLEFLYGSRCKY